jgi:hypothetical protein
MRGRALFFLIALMLGIALIASCKPVNLFSPFVDPSKLSNEAKLEAGYNAIGDGDYEEAVDYFTDVIESSSGEELTDGLIGRATAYLNIGAPNLDEATQDIMEGETDIDNLGEFIRNLKGSNDYATFFATVQLAAMDYNDAMANSGGITDSGLLIEIYQTNMMAATGVGATRIAFENDNVAVGITDPEIDAILESGGHQYNIDTWGSSSPPNGLTVYVAGVPADRAEMLGYLQGAYDALNLLELDPPLDMDIPSMKSGINDWVTNGLGAAALS